MPIKRILVLDGKNYTAGPLEEGVTLATYLYPSANGEIHGFSDKRLFLDWADKEGKRKAIDDGFRRIQKANQEIMNLTESQRRKLESDQVEMVNRARAELLTKLKGIKPNDIKKLDELARRGEIGSVYLYDREHYGGAWIYLPGPLHYPDLRFFKVYGERANWNDRASSWYNCGPHTIILFEKFWYRGRQFWVEGQTSDPTPGSSWNWSDITSSVLA